MSLSTTTRDHEEIRRWAEQRGAIPSEVASTHSRKEPGILRFQFPGAPGENDRNLQEISWDAFFEKFDENELALLYQEKTADGEPSNFNKLVHPSEPSSSGKSSSGTSGKSAMKSKSSSQKGTAAAVRETEEDEDEDIEDEESQDADEE